MWKEYMQLGGGEIEGEKGVIYMEYGMWKEYMQLGDMG